MCVCVCSVCSFMCTSYIHSVIDTFIGLDILMGRSMVLSRLYCWVKEYISFMWVCRVDGVCDLMGDIVMGKWIGEGVCVVLMELWCPMIIGMAGAIAWFAHVSVSVCR